MNLVFIIFGLLMVVTAFGVILAKNPIYSALFLVSNLIGVACIYASLNAHFLSAVQLIVYAGAIVVLVLFVLMLLNIKTENTSKVSIFSISTVAGAAILFLSLITPILMLFKKVDIKGATKLTMANSEGTVEAMGSLLYGKYVFTFEIASMLIMVALVGSIMLAKKKENL